MIDMAIAKAVKEMNRKALVTRIDYVDSRYIPAKDFALAVIYFENGQCFEVNAVTFKDQFLRYQFRMKKGGS